ncbi:MAG: DUF447 domain-containing protein [Haloarculaceae archaeon]
MTGGSLWPVELRGVTESVVTTEGPNGRWNVAALGLHAPGESGEPGAAAVTARTYGRTRTRRNFEARSEGYVQFTRDPLDFTEAALAIREEDDPLLASADAWVRVAVHEVARAEEGGTPVVTWALDPVEAGVERETVPTTNRGFGAVVEVTVAASRLGVDAYDQGELRERLAYFAEVVETCGGPREHEALARARELVDADF